MDSSQIKLVIATPAFNGQIYLDYFSSMMKSISVFAQNKISISVITLPNESLITRGRNVLVSKFLANEQNTHLLFIDADIAWDAIDIVKMLHADKDIIGGVYPKKNIYWSKVTSEKVQTVIKSLSEGSTQEEYTRQVEPLLLNYVVRNLQEKDNVENINNVMEVESVGTGFMLIKRHVFEKMIEVFNHTKFNYGVHISGAVRKEEEFLYALFDCKVVNGDYLSEDYLFCKRWRDTGGKVYVYTAAKLNHTGTKSYSGDYSLTLL